MNLSSSKNSSSSGLLIPVIIGVLLAVIVGGFIIAQFADTAFPVEASAEAEQVDQLFKVMLGLGGGLFLFVEGMLLFSVLRFRVRPGDTGDGPPIHGNVTLELVWTAIPSVVVFVLVIYSYQVWTDIRAPKENEMVIQATGQRFAWSFSYYEPRLDCESDQVNPELDCANRTIDPNIKSSVLHLYVGRPVRMEMHTEDVIHSFWVPAMRIKQDLLPGRETSISFVPTKAGEFRVTCAELCGSGHGSMFAKIIVHEDEDSYLTSFIDPAVDNVVHPPEDPVQLGGQLLASGAYPCQGCHTLSDPDYGIDWTGITGPVLNGVGDRAGTREAGLSAEEYILTSIYDTSNFLVPGYGNLMLQFQSKDPNGPNYLPVDDAKVIAAFLCTQTDTGESACDLDNLDTFAQNFMP